MDRTRKSLLQGLPTPTVATLRHLKNTPCSAMKALTAFSDVLRLLYTYDVTCCRTLTNLNVTDGTPDRILAWCPTWLTVRRPELYRRQTPLPSDLTPIAISLWAPGTPSIFPQTIFGSKNIGHSFGGDMFWLTRPPGSMVVQHRPKLSQHSSLGRTRRCATPSGADN